MKITEIIKEHVNTADAFVNGNMIDPQLAEIKKRAREYEEGLDPDLAEIMQDFPT